MIKILYWSSCTLYYCPILMKLVFSWQFLEQILKYKISRKSVQWEPKLFHEESKTDGQANGREDGRKERQTDRQTDRHEEVNSRFSQFCELAQNVLSVYFPS